MRLRKSWYALILLVCLVISGCWDYQELENRAIIVGLGIDELPPVRSQGKVTRMYQVVIQIIEPLGESGKTGAGMGKKNQQGNGYTNFVVETPSISAGINRIVTLSDRIPNLAHLQLIILGEKVARKGINELYDFFTRFPQMRRQTVIAVARESILPYFTITSAAEPSPALHMAEMLDSVSNTLFLPETNLKSMSKNVRRNIPFFLLKARLDHEREIVIEEAVVFKELKMTGSLSLNEMKDLSMIHNEIDRGVLEFSCYPGKKVVYQIVNGHTRLKPSKVLGKPYIKIQTELEGEISEYQCLDASLDEPEQIEKLERKYSRILAQHIKQTVERLKRKYRSDLFRFTVRLKNQPDLYKWIRKDPSSFFQALTVDVKVDLKVRNIGNTLKTPSPFRSP